MGVLKQNEQVIRRAAQSHSRKKDKIALLADALLIMANSPILLKLLPS